MDNNICIATVLQSKRVNEYSKLGDLLLNRKEVRQIKHTKKEAQLFLNANGLNPFMTCTVTDIWLAMFTVV